MNLQQMIELSVLDAMGLLDETEQGQFESAFRAASPQVQAQVRREQTRLSVIDALLPEVEAPAGLRAAVLDAVRRHIQGASGPADVAGVLPPMIQSRSVSRVWRAAALALAAASVVMGVATFEFYNRSTELQLLMSKDLVMAGVVQQFGGNYVHDVLFNKDTKRVVFSPTAPDSKSQVSVFINPEWKEAKLFHVGLGDAEQRTYRLALIDDQNRVVSILKSFNPAGDLDGVTFVLEHPAPKSHLAILTKNSAGKDEVVQTGELPAPTL